MRIYLTGLGFTVLAKNLPIFFLCAFPSPESIRVLTLPGTQRRLCTGKSNYELTELFQNV